MDPSSAAWSKFFNTNKKFYNNSTADDGSDRREIAQNLDDKTDESSTPPSAEDTITINGIEDKDNPNENVKISKQVLKKWAKDEIAVGKTGVRGESFKLLSSIGLTTAPNDTFQLFNEAKMKAFQSVHGYAEKNEIKAKVVAPKYYSAEKPHLTAENSPLKPEVIKAIPAQLTKRQAEQTKAQTQPNTTQAAQTESSSTTGTQESGTEGTSGTQPGKSATNETTGETKKTEGTKTTAQAAKQNPTETVKIKINGVENLVTLTKIAEALNTYNIESLLTLMEGKELAFKDNQNNTFRIQIPKDVLKDVLKKVLKLIFDDETQRSAFIGKFIAKDQVEALLAFLGDEKSELLDKLSPEEKARINNLLSDSSTANTSTETDEEVDPNKLIDILVRVGNAVAPSTKSVKVAWIASKLGNLPVAELEKLFKGEEASFPNNSGSGTYKVKIKPDHLKTSLRLIAKDPAELFKLTDKLKTTAHVNAFIKFIGKNTKEAQQVLIQLQPDEIMRLLNASDDLDELAKILEIKNTNKLWAKLAGLDETQLKALMNKEVSGIKLFEKLGFNSLDESLNIKNIGLPKTAKINFLNSDWEKNIDLKKLKSADFKQLLLTLDDKQLKTFMGAKSVGQVTALLNKLKPEEVAEILSRPNFIKSLNSVKFLGETESSLNNIMLYAFDSDNSAKILSKLEPKVLNNLLKSVNVSLREVILQGIKGLKNSPLNQILAKLDDTELKALLNLKNGAGEELFKHLNLGNTVDEAFNTIKPGMSTGAANGILGQLKNLAKGAKDFGVIKTLGKIIKPVLPILQKVAKAIPILAPIIDLITGIAFDKESYGKSAAGTVGSFAGGWIGGIGGAAAGTALAAATTVGMAALTGPLALLAVPVGGIVGVAVTILCAIAGSAGGGMLGDALYEAIKGFLPQELTKENPLNL